MEWSDDPIKFITNALSPAKVISIKLNDEEKSAVVEVADDQLSLAIGKSGQNVRLAARLTGWKIDLVGESGERPSPDEQSAETTDSVETTESVTEPVTDATPEVTVEPAVETTETSADEAPTEAAA